MDFAQHLVIVGYLVASFAVSAILRPRVKEILGATPAHLSCCENFYLVRRPSAFFARPSLLLYRDEGSS